MSDTRPYPKNVPGPFYVVDQCCTLCGVTEGAAPELFATDNDHCYVCRQPESAGELDAMLEAMEFSEFLCVRYRGVDPDILQRIKEIGMESCSDHFNRVGGLLVRQNHASFRLSRAEDRVTAPEVAAAFVDWMSPRPWATFKMESKSEWKAELTLTDHQKQHHPINFETSFYTPQISCHVSIPHKSLPRAWSVVGCIQSWLESEARFTDLRWYSDDEWNSTRNWHTSPW